MAGGTVYSAMQERWARESNPRPRVERVFAANVLLVKVGDVVPEITAFGEVRSQRVLDLRATAAGVIIELADGFNEGGTVKAGTLLARIDPQNAQSALALAQADLTEAEAEIFEAARALELARDEVTSANRQAELREQASTRQKNLRTRGVGTDAAVEIGDIGASCRKPSGVVAQAGFATSRGAGDAIGHAVGASEGQSGRGRASVG